MRIVTVAFDYSGVDMYARLLRVFEYSVAQHMPNASFEVVRIPAPDGVNERQRSHVSNTWKFREWARVMREADPADEIVFCDCDMLMTGDLSDAFDFDFDVAYTRRLAKFPMNGGVVFARPTEAALAFFELWREWNDRFYRDPAEHRPWKVKYGGMNQAAFGKVVNDVEYDATVIALPCEVYNATDSDWGSVTDNTRMIHCKSNLRRAIFSRLPNGRNTRYTEATIKLALQWQALEREIVSAGASALRGVT